MIQKMKKNNTIKEIADRLESANSALIFPHVLMDGDTLGSSVALLRALRQKGKTAYIVIEDEVPGYLTFLDDGSCTFDQDMIKEPDVCISVDCGDVERFPLRKEKFFTGKTTVSIDHHKTAIYFADLNHVDQSAAATAEIIYDLIHQMGASIDKLTGEAIYAAILTDTGNFQYSNTRVKSYQIAIELYGVIDHNYVSRMLYQNNRIERLYISAKILATLKMMAGGRAVMAYVTQDMLKEAGALMEDTEGISEVLRDIKGIEIGVFAKETAKDETKFSMRSKAWADVSEIAIKHQGGGHTKAAGCTVKKPIAEAMKMIEIEIEEYLARNNGER
ncbi:MAG: bifunctional oligoribonuclease/PAP phosphatase NrnA [Clostridiales bacterium]|nr:bifunctional oligoribonuclease/PAP phosphatase NrnA [Clostridiales bacterium]